MTLMAIKQHMTQVKMASLSSLCTVFNTDPDTLRAMIAHWIRKGNLRCCRKKPACGTKCFQCPAAMVEIYEWV